MAMVINDLKQVCSPCKGTGRQAGRSQWGINQINPDGRCLACEGRGFLLTELGRELMALLRPFVLEMMDSREAETPKPAEALKPAGAPPREAE
ncbi:MAG: hypothetical protein O7A67_00940 [SAR324 cluster bacterium]|nr:hypothetical protein [SAR324 cluster bacterium]